MTFRKNVNSVHLFFAILVQLQYQLSHYTIPVVHIFTFNTKFLISFYVLSRLFTLLAKCLYCEFRLRVMRWARTLNNKNPGKCYSHRPSCSQEKERVTIIWYTPFTRGFILILTSIIILFQVLRYIAKLGINNTSYYTWNLNKV